MTEKQKVLEEELQQLKTRSSTSRKPPSPSKVLKTSSDKPFVLLNKVTEPSSSSALTTLRRKDLLEEIEVCEIQLVDNDEGRYEIEILEAECEDGGEVEVIEVPQIVTDEKFEVIPAKQTRKSPKAKKIVYKNPPQDQNQVDSYCRVIPEGTKVELDATGEKKIFQCGFLDCAVTFSRRQQCKTHYFNHLAKNSQFSCKVCLKKFKTASALERHVRVHTNSKVNLHKFHFLLNFS